MQKYSHYRKQQFKESESLMKKENSIHKFQFHIKNKIGDKFIFYLIPQKFRPPNYKVHFQIENPTRIIYSHFIDDYKKSCGKNQ